MNRGRVCAAVAGASLVVASGCATSGTREAPPADEWASKAEAWLSGYDAAAARDETAGAPGASLYYAPDVLLEVRGQFPAETFYGRGEIVLFDQTAMVSTRHTFGEPYLDATGFVRTEALVWAEPGRPPLAGLRSSEVAPAGIVAVHAFDWIQAPVIQKNPAFADSRTTASTLARAYVGAWSDADHAVLRQLYWAGATLEDSLLGIKAIGREAIVALADSQTAARTTLEIAGDLYEPDVIPGSGVSEAPALYLSWRFERPDVTHPARLLMLTHAAENCPGASAVELTLSEGQIIAERRFHALASARSCLDTDDLADGWWTGRDLPAPLSDRVTGRLDSPSGAIEIRNGTPELEDLIRWGLGRYAAAGLDEPRVERITFDPFAAPCRQFQGYTTSPSGSPAILICSDAGELARRAPSDEPCIAGECRTPASGRTLILHELGHAWLITRADGPNLARFAHHVATAGWIDAPGVPAEHPTELAARTLAWGLSGGRGAPSEAGSPECGVVARAFELLTGELPLTECA